MKTCSFCLTKKEDTEFSIRSDTGSLRSRCKPCQKEYAKLTSRKHYEENRESVIASKKERRREVSQMLRELKDGKPCADCGGAHPYWRLDFDHLRDKKFLVSFAMCGGYSLDTIQQEIAKCDLVCANCHRDRTHKRQQDSDNYKKK